MLDNNESTMKCPQPLFDLVTNAFSITLATPNEDLINDSFQIDPNSLSVPKPFITNYLEENIQFIKDQQKIREEKQKEEQQEKNGDDDKEEAETKQDEPKQDENKDDVDDVEDGKDEEKIDPNREKKILEAKRKEIEKRLTEFIAKPFGGALTSWKAYLIYLDDTGLHKIGTGYSGTEKGKIYGTIKDIYLSSDNLAWITTWINDKDNYQWILIRFRYDMTDKDKDTAIKDRLSGKILVVDANKFVILGEILQNGQRTKLNNTFRMIINNSVPLIKMRIFRRLRFKCFKFF